MTSIIFQGPWRANALSETVKVSDTERVRDAREQQTSCQHNEVASRCHSRRQTQQGRLELGLCLWMFVGERSLLSTRIATTESVSLCTRMKS
jgi:hypothetical protein